MRRTLLIALLALAVGILVLLALVRHRTPATTNTPNASAATVTPNTNSPLTNAPVQPSANVNAPVPPTQLAASVTIPVTDFFARVMKKHFGQYITPQNSPIQPERFRGYHTGADAETTPAEATVDLPVFAFAVGTVVFVGHVNGYGGVIMVRATVNTETITALYGHIRLTSVTVRKGDSVIRGERLAVLGTGFSSETDGERKHLHFGLLKGAVINYRGYVRAKSELSAWLDPVAWLTAHGAGTEPT